MGYNLLLVIWCSSCFRFASESPFELVSVSFWLVPLIFEHFHSLWPNKMSQVHLCFPCSIPGISHFFQDPWFFSREQYLAGKVWVLVVLIAIGESLLSGLLSEQKLEIHACMYIHIFASIFVSLSSNMYWKLCVQTDVLNSSIAPQDLV